MALAKLSVMVTKRSVLVERRKVEGREGEEAVHQERMRDCIFGHDVLPHVDNRWPRCYRFACRDNKVAHQEEILAPLGVK